MHEKEKIEPFHSNSHRIQRLDSKFVGRSAPIKDNSMVDRKKLQNVPPYLDPDKPIAVRVRDLLGKMTLEEKVSQTGFVMGKKVMKNGRFSPDLAKKFFATNGIGGVMDPMEPGAATRRHIRAGGIEVFEEL